MKTTTYHRFYPSYQEGLTADQVAQRHKEGLTNKVPGQVGKSNGQIVLKTVVTPFNMINLLLAACLIFVGAWANTVFIIMVLVNIWTRLSQELRSRRLIHDLSLLSVPKVTVLRDSQQVEIDTLDIVLDDVLLLEASKQIPSDSRILFGELEVNEALLTGESDPVVKKVGDNLLSGSIVISGKCFAQTEKVGADNYASQIAEDAKKIKAADSELLKVLHKISTIGSILIIPVGILLFYQALSLRGDLPKTAVVSTVTALLGILPIGPLLLVSICLAAGFIRLSMKKVLMQDLYSLEVLAHVDTLCLDKTGTITEGNMEVQRITPLNQTALPLPLEKLMGSFLANTDDNNATFLALKRHFPDSSPLEVTYKVPFSSQRRWSGISFKGLGTLIVGAPDQVLEQKEPLPESMIADENRGIRTLIVGFTPLPLRGEDLPLCAPIASIGISDMLRRDAAKTIEALEESGIEIKVISGDNPLTVSAIAHKAGIAHYDSAIDMTQALTEDEIAAAASQYTVFGRVSPHQKGTLVRSLQGENRTVAMTGDGVNDILALREADCGITMADGSDAAKQVSQLILLNSDFSILPDLFNQGKRTMNNITRVAGVFFVKNIYSLILAIACIFMNLPFPFTPLQITLIDWIVEGFPSFLLTFDSDISEITEPFFVTAFRKALPNGLAIGLCALATYFLGHQLSIAGENITTILYYLVGFVSMLAVYKAFLPLNLLRGIACVCMTIGFVLSVTLGRELLGLSLLPATALPLLVGILAASLLVERLLAWVVNNWILPKKASLALGGQ